MWNFTVMGILLVSSSGFPKINDDSYQHAAQKQVTSLTPDDLNIYSKLYLQITTSSLKPWVHFIISPSDTILEMTRYAVPWGTPLRQARVAN